MRERFNAFIGEHEVVWELAMALLAIAFVDDGARYERGRAL